jgi:acyl-CoA reductase-like NAD-dependent aldehyde dehydrogenase
MTDSEVLQGSRPTAARQGGTAPESQPYSGFEQQFIGGRWCTARGKALRDRNPYNGEVLVEIPQASADDLDFAYTAAAKAQPAWADALPGQRAAVMRRAAAIMEHRREEIVSWLIRESGSTRIKATLEWSAVHAVMLEAASAPYRVEGRILPGDVPGKECRVYRRPVGVVGVISPWNWPLQLTNRSLAPALAVGNSAVVKPASDTPVTGGLLLAKIFEEAGLPEGVLSVVVGPGSEIGDAIVKHPVPRVISFTGSTPVGRAIAGGTPQGLVLPPHVFTDVTPDMKLAREEIFGPIAPILRAEGEEEALRIANGTAYGLSGAVFSGDIARGVRFARHRGGHDARQRSAGERPSEQSVRRRKELRSGPLRRGLGDPGVHDGPVGDGAALAAPFSARFRRAPRTVGWRLIPTPAMR